MLRKYMSFDIVQGGRWPAAASPLPYEFFISETSDLHRKIQWAMVECPGNRGLKDTIYPRCRSLVSAEQCRLGYLRTSAFGSTGWNQILYHQPFGLPRLFYMFFQISNLSVSKYRTIAQIEIDNRKSNVDRPRCSCNCLWVELSLRSWARLLQIGGQYTNI